jgi:hypothetical protein
VLILKLHMKLDFVTPQADVVDRNGRIAESQSEAKAINIEANGFRQIASAKNRLNLLAKGKRRPCCFDRSGIYDKSLSCPIADDTSK